jgi:hypothetical protein
MKNFINICINLPSLTSWVEQTYTTPHAVVHSESLHSERALRIHHHLSTQTMHYLRNPTLRNYSFGRNRKCFCWESHLKVFSVVNILSYLFECRKTRSFSFVFPEPHFAVHIAHIVKHNRIQHDFLQLVFTSCPRNVRHSRCTSLRLSVLRIGRGTPNIKNNQMVIVIIFWRRLKSFTKA